MTGICQIAVTPLRSEPSNKSEMISQLLYGEAVQILKTGSDDWIWVECLYDRYQGWIDKRSVMFFESLPPLTEGEILFPADAGFVLDAFGLKVPVTRGAVINRSELLGHTRPLESPDNHSLLTETALSYINTPYLWGGRSPFGIDCSGLSQMVYKFHKIPLPRDAKDQATTGVPVSSLKASTPGDLAFFDNDRGEIVHVGILLGASLIIHASGKVRVDKMDDKGIYNEELKAYTHPLRLVTTHFRNS